MKLPSSFPVVPARRGATHCSRRRSTFAARGLAAALAGLCTLAVAPARATLGEDLSSVETDRLQLQATAHHVNHGFYTVHEIATPNGVLVREYASPAGQVFAVTWHGPFMPNLRQVLGVHFDELGKAQEKSRGGLGHASARTDKVAYVSNGRLRSFHGSAYLIHGLPSGVSLNDIQ